MTELTTLIIGAIGGFFASMLSLRKDDRVIHTTEITKERTKWRDNIRELAKEISDTFHSELLDDKLKVANLRVRLVTALNPKDEHDNKIIEHFDKIFDKKDKDINKLFHRIALLLKHDWERCKWDCAPLLEKIWLCITCKCNKEWNSKNYRSISLD